MAEKLTWAEYQARFPAPFDISSPTAWRDDPDYDLKRKANMKWQADFYLLGFSADAPSVFMINPFLHGGWYYGTKGAAEWIPDPRPQPAVDWAAEAAAGRPVIGPVVAAVPVSGGVAAPKKKGFFRRLFG